MHLHASGIRKSFGRNVALDGVDLEIRPGEVLAVLGENGAGKSTLVRILTGAHRPDSGELIIDGQASHFADTRASMHAGIHAIYQEIRQNLFAQLSVAENIYMADAGRFGTLFVRKGAARRAAATLLESIGVALDPRARVGDLSVSEQQMVELATVVAAKCSLLILDEPTAALDQAESERLFDQVRRLRSEGVSIVYVSHRLEEVFALADRLVVLRDGRVSVEGRTSDFTEAEIVRAMVGQSIENFYPKEHHVMADTVLAVEGLTSRGGFSDVDLTVRAGEIVGIGGALGCGRGPLLQALFGARPIDAGTVTLDGHQVRPNSTAAAIRAGFGFISEDRQRDGLCLQRSVSDNVTLAATRRFAGPVGYLRSGRERAAAQNVIDELRIRTESPRTEVARLSGGNQQKVLFGRWVVEAPRVLLLQEPTRGVDVGARVEIYRHLNRLTADGTAVIIVTSDLPELCEMSDRVLVMRAGRVVAELTGDLITQENVLHHALSEAA